MLRSRSTIQSIMQGSPHTHTLLCADKSKMVIKPDTSLTKQCCSMVRCYNGVAELNDLWEGDLLTSGVLGQQDQQLKDEPN